MDYLNSLRNVLEKRASSWPLFAALGFGGLTALASAISNNKQSVKAMDSMGIRPRPLSYFLNSHNKPNPTPSQPTNTIAPQQIPNLPFNMPQNFNNYYKGAGIVNAAQRAKILD